MPYYETVFIARPDLTEKQVAALTDELVQIIKDQGGKSHKIEQWGLRTLAYRINKSRKGHYTLIQCEASGPAINELERRMRLNEDIMRSLTTRIKELSDEPSVMMGGRDDDDDNDSDNEKEAA